MNDSTNSSLPSETQAWDALTRLALDLSWSWNHSADEIWKRLDPELWELTANPWLILQSMSPRKLDALKLEVQADAAFRQRIEQLLTKLNEKNAAPAWFQTAHPSSPRAHGSVLQHGIHVERSAPHLLRRPWKRRRRSVESRERLGRSRGCHRAPLSTGVLPSGTRRPRRPAGSLSSERARTVAHSPGSHIGRRVAQNGADITRREGLGSHVGGAGRTNSAVLAGYERSGQSAECQSLTSELYGGGPELRLKQEMLLGIGGWRFLRELRIPRERLPLERRPRRLRRTGKSSRVHGGNGPAVS